MRNITNITPPRVPLTDPRTGMISREWYRFFLNLFVLTGSGSNDVTLEDLQKTPVDMSATAFAEINQLYNQALSSPASDSQIAQLTDRVNKLDNAVNSQPVLTAQVAYLAKQIDNLSLGVNSQPSPIGSVTSISFGTTGFTPSIPTIGAVTVAGTLNVSNGGTGQNSLTDKQVLFYNGTAGKVFQDANFVWDYTNTYLGIGTSTPTQILHVSKAGTLYTLIENATATVANQSSLYLGAASSRTQVISRVSPSTATKVPLDILLGSATFATFDTDAFSLKGSTSGTITIGLQAAAGTYNFNLPISAGTSGKPLLSGGGGATAMTFDTLSVGGGGTGTSTAFTAGSVVFAGASGVYSQDNANLFWDDSNNRLGIGTSTPSYSLHTAGSGAIYNLVQNTGAGPSQLFFGAANTQTQFISRDATTGGVPLNVIVGTTTVATFNTTGFTLGTPLAVGSGGTGASSASITAFNNITGYSASGATGTTSTSLVFSSVPTFTTTIGVGGATASASGSGVSFPATQSASTDPNTLDDYEEGTFTPVIVGSTLSGTGTYSIQVGKYTKIGNRVFITMYVVWSAHTGTGNMSLSGLPFVSSSDANSFSALAIWTTNLTLTANNIACGYVNVGASTATLQQTPTGSTTVAAIPMDTAANILISSQYTV